MADRGAMAFQGQPPFGDESASPSAPGVDLPLPIRQRPARGAAPREDSRDEEPFQGCPIFPLDGADAYGVPYRDKFARHGFTQGEAEANELGLRVRLLSANPTTGGTSTASFTGPLLPISTSTEAIHDRWGPGKYEVTLARRSAGDRVKKGTGTMTRTLALMPRTGKDFGPDGEFDVGDEPWPIDPDDPSLTAAMRAEMQRRERVRDEFAAQEAYGDGYDAPPRGGHAPAPPPGAGFGPTLPAPTSPAAYPLGTPFQLVNGQLVAMPSPAAPAKPSAFDGILAALAENPLEAIGKLAAAATAIKSVVVPAAPPAPTAQEIAAATAAAVAQAMAPALQTIAQAVAAKPIGPDPTDVMRAELAREREAAERRLAEERAAREREHATQMLAAQREVADRDRKFALEMERLRHEQRAAELRFELERARGVSETEKAGLLRELDEVRKKLRAGEEDAAPDWSEKLATLADTRFGEAAAPGIVRLFERIADAVTAPSAPTPQAPALLPDGFIRPPAPPIAPPIASSDASPSDDNDPADSATEVP